MVKCKDNRYIKTHKINSESQDAILDSHNKKIDFMWTKSVNWIESDLGSMRVASFKVPYSRGLGDLSVIVLSQDGGGIKSNINRWRKQIGLKEQSLLEINTYSEILTNKLGSYRFIKIINDMNPERAFLCSIIPLEDSTIFIKLSLHKDGINETEKDFKYFCNSFKPIK